MKEKFYCFHAGGQLTPGRISGPYTKELAEWLMDRDRDFSRGRDRSVGDITTILTDNEAHEHELFEHDDPYCLQTFQSE